MCIRDSGLSEVTATYTLLPDGNIRVENAGYKQDAHGRGRYKRAIGRAKIPDITRDVYKRQYVFYAEPGFKAYKSIIKAYEQTRTRHLRTHDTEGWIWRC